MGKTRLIVSLIVVVIFVFGLGGLTGIFYQKQKDAPRAQKTAEKIQTLSSKVVNAIVTYGTVTSIEGNKNITLSHDGEAMTISITPNAKVYIYENATKKEVNFSEVKIGDNVNITASLDQSGSIVGNMIVIFTRNNIGK